MRKRISEIFKKCGMNVYDVDVSELAIKEAKKRVMERFEAVNSLENGLNIADVFGGPFDLIIASECMYFLQMKKELCYIKKYIMQ